MKKHIHLAISLAALLVSATVSASPINILNVSTTGFSATGTPGVLRDATWSSGSTPTDLVAIADGISPAEGTQWNNSSFWWDAVTSATEVTATFYFDRAYSITNMTMQADDNDRYHVEAWDGSAWSEVWTVLELPSAGLRTRLSGLFSTPVVTDRLRFSASAGDSYYAISEVQAFAEGSPTTTPEPTALGLLAIALGGVGAASLYKRQHCTV
jgi:hypothetical protein